MYNDENWPCRLRGRADGAPGRPADEAGSQRQGAGAVHFRHKLDRYLA